MLSDRPTRRRLASGIGRAVRDAFATATAIAAALALLAGGAAPSPALADNEARLPDDARAASAARNLRPFKLTLGEYHYSEGSNGTDLNLRYRGDVYSGWIGIYHDKDFGQQWRGGLERSFELFPNLPLSLQFSGQIASRGFLGGSVTLEYGEPFFVLGGWGRTNGQPYFNLNFDPNDSWTVATGYRGDKGVTAYLMAVRDNRFNPGQQNLHAVLRLAVPDRRHLTIDLQRKSGNADFGPIRDWALTLTYDVRDWSFRLANDRGQNFSQVNALRLSVAYRF